MYAKDVGTPLEVFRGQAHKTADGRIQADYTLSDTGRVVLRQGPLKRSQPPPETRTVDLHAPPKVKRELPKELALYSEAKKEFLAKQGVRPGDSFDKFVIRRGTPEHDKVNKIFEKLKNGRT